MAVFCSGGDGDGGGDGNGKGDVVVSGNTLAASNTGTGVVASGTWSDAVL